MRYQLAPTSLNVVTQDQLMQKAHEFADVEVCGVITRTNDIVMIANVSPEPEKYFQMAQEDWFALSRSHSPNDILGIFHTHPSQASFPSVLDVEALHEGSYLLPHWKYWIVTKQGVFEWEFDYDPAVL